MDLFSYRYPETPGCKTGGASLAAAISMSQSGRDVGYRLKALAYLKQHGACTADDIAAALNTIPGNIRPRLSQLLKGGLVEKLTETGPSINGAPQHKWRAV
jgi:predicted ArsR family transcriptional regulator